MDNEEGEEVEVLEELQPTEEVYEEDGVTDLDEAEEGL